MLGVTEVDGVSEAVTLEDGVTDDDNEIDGVVDGVGLGDADG